MRHLLMTALAATAMASATPAFAAATIVDQNGPDLDIRIHASQDDESVAPNVGTVVYANAGDANSAGHNTQFSGYTSFDSTTGTFGSATTVDIKEGGGFAQLNDHDFSSQDAATQDLFAVVMDITTFDFSKYEFSIMLADAGSISVYYMLSGGSTWLSADGNPLITAGNDNQFILSAEAGTGFDKVLIASTGSSIFQIKQNSVEAFAGGVPEPGTWGMMLLGFAGIGMTIRRSRKQSGRLLQIA